MNEILFYQRSQPLLFTPFTRILSVLFALLLFFPPHFASAEPQALRLAVVEMTEPGFAATTVNPIRKALSSVFPSEDIVILRVNSATLESSVRELRPDFIISPAADFLRLVDAVGAHPIATRKTRWARDPHQSTGAAVIALSSRTDITTLSSLKGLKAAATLPTSLDGWLALRGEIEDAGMDSEQFFSKLRFFGYGMPHVVEAVLSGAYDAGVVPVCTLERIEAEGLIEPGVLRVAALKEEKEGAESLCRTSTTLYPDLIFAALPSADPETVRSATLALLGLGAGEYSWYPTSDFHAVRALEERLHIGPWAYLEEMTPSALWRRWRIWILGAAGLVLLLLLSELRLRELVRRRTADLQAALAERDRLAASEENIRSRLSRLERMGAVSQLCAIVAHELKQPVGAVINYLAVARLKTGISAASPLPAPGTESQADPVLITAIDGADMQARRIARIVDRVRGYARAEKSRPVRLRISDVLRSALAGVKLSSSLPVEAHLPPQSPVILGDALEVELILHNLIKNAIEAVKDDPAGKVAVRVSSTDSEVSITVDDNGKPLTDEAFERLSRVSASGKSDGLGLGLGIVRNLVEENGGRLTLSRLPGRGLRAEVRFDIASDAEPGENTEKQSFPEDLKS